MKYKYVIFEDVVGKVFVIRDTLVKTCVFAGSIGELKEVERGTLIKPESDRNFLSALFNKKEEYLSKRLLPS